MLIDKWENPSNFDYKPLEGERDQPQISVDAEALYDLLTGKYGFKFNKLKHKTMTRQEIEERKNALASLILDREAKLKEHDYVSAKIADGRATADEYAEVIAQKSIWAKEVNDAQEEIAYLVSITPEDEEFVE